MEIIAILAAFAGGIFGSIVSGTIAFIFTGLMALIGIAISLSTGDASFLNEVAFGPFFSPSVAFVGAVAAAAYAGKIRDNKQDLDNYPQGQDVNFPLFGTNNSMVLVIGGIFGVLGYVTNFYLGKISIGMDTVALTVVIYGVVARYLFGGSLMSKDIKAPYFDANNLLFNTVAGLAFGLATSFVVLKTGVNNLGWAFSAVSLIFAFTTVKSFPVSHHITMSTGYFALASGNFYIGAVAGVIASLLGIVVAKFTNENVDSHLDMPAVVIFIASIIALNIF